MKTRILSMLLCIVMMLGLFPTVISADDRAAEVPEEAAASYSAVSNRFELGDVSGNGSVTSIYGYAFDGCSGFTDSLTIPDSVTSIDAYAFRECSNLQSAYFYGNAPTTFGSRVFDGTAPGFIIYHLADKSVERLPHRNF